MRLVILLMALLLWPSIAGAIALFFINGLGPYGAFSETPEIGFRSLRLAALEGFEIGLRTTPFLSLAPAAMVFAARRWIPRLHDVAAGIFGAVIVFVFFIVWITIEPLDPLLGGIIPLAIVLLLISGALTGMLVRLLSPRPTPSTPSP